MSKGLLCLLILGASIGASRSITGASALAVQAAGRDPFSALIAQSRELGPVRASQRVSFVALLRDPAAKQRTSKLADMYDPHSAGFGRYQATSSWATAGSWPSRATRSARSYLGPTGITVSTLPGSDWLIIGGPAGAIERVFRVSIDVYVDRSGIRYYAATHDPVITGRLAGVLAQTGHISSYPNRRTHIIPVAGLRPTDLLNAYDIQPLHTHNLTGSGQTIAFIEIDGFRQADLNAFTQHFSLPSMHPMIVAGRSLSKVEGEAELDLEIAHEIAPGARLVVYNCSVICTNNQMLQLETQAVRQNPRGIISISLGGCETAQGSGDIHAESSVFLQADALGESVLVASGDSGAYTCLQQDSSAVPSPQYLSVSSPASEPGVTAVGGTSLSLHANSTWYRELAWQNAPATAGSGGGLSSFFSRPSWQRGPGVVNAYNTANRREVPDVSADADPLTGAQVVITGKLTQVGGTSQATPIWAGIVALTNQYLRRQGHPVAGFLNPALYTLAVNQPTYPAFHDITEGTNLEYPATPGYDLATGIGSPDAWNLARDLSAYEGGKR